MNSIPLAYYALSGVINFVASFGLCLFVYLKNKKSRLNQTFAFFCLAVAQWSLFYFLWLRTESPDTADFLLRTCMIGVIFMPSSFTHFIIHLLGIKTSRVTIFGNYFISFLIASTIYSPLYAHEGGAFLVFPYWARPGLVFPVHLLHFAVNVLYSHYKMHEALKKGSQVSSRNQIKYVFIGTSIGYIAGVMNYFCWYRIPIPPFINVAVTLYVVSVAYAIVKHQLMDIEVVIKKAVVFTTLLVIVYGVFAGVTLITQELIAGGRNIGLLLSSLVVALTVAPIKEFLVNITDKFLFQKKYNPVRMIHDFSQAVVTELDLNKLTKQTIDILSTALRLDRCAVFIPSKEGDKFHLRDSIGIENKKFVIDEKSDLILRVSRSGVVLEPTSEMKLLGVVACVGILIRKNLIGVLALGKKKSDEDYTQEDMGVLNILADALGIGITNALAYEKLRHQADLVTVGTLAAGIKHDISKPIDRMNLEASGILSRLRNGGVKDPAKMLNEAGSIIERCCNTFQDVIAISEKYAASPKESEKPVLLNIAAEIDAALSVVQHKINGSEIRVKKEIQDNLPQIIFDKDYLRQVLVNLLNNAVDAIDAADRKTNESIITIRGGRVENRTLNVRLEINDTGIGIPEKIKDKIFKSWFTTKGEKGTGLGLALVSELVLRGGGTVEVESQEGKGTTFILGFKGQRLIKTNNPS